MKVLIMTTMADHEEMVRLTEETVAMGHECKLADLSKISYSIIDSTVIVKELSDFTPDKVVMKGITRNKALIVTLIKQFRDKGIPVFDNNYADHHYSINKSVDLIKLADKGIPVPDTYYVNEYDEYFDIAEKIGYPVIVKMIGAGKGAGVMKADDRSGLEWVISEARDRIGKTADRFIIEEFIPYVHDLRVLIIGDHHFVMKRIPGNGEFRANFSLGGSVEMFDLDEKGIALAHDALAAINMTIGGVDILITEDDRRYILEVNHTPGFIGMEKATNQNIAKMYLEHALEAAF